MEAELSHLAPTLSTPNISPGWLGSTGLRAKLRWESAHRGRGVGRGSAGPREFEEAHRLGLMGPVRQPHVLGCLTDALTRIGCLTLSRPDAPRPRPPAQRNRRT